MNLPSSVSWIYVAVLSNLLILVTSNAAPVEFELAAFEGAEHIVVVLIGLPKLHVIEDELCHGVVEFAGCEWCTSCSGAHVGFNIGHYALTEAWSRVSIPCLTNGSCQKMQPSHA